MVAYLYHRSFAQLAYREKFRCVLLRLLLDSGNPWLAENSAEAEKPAAPPFFANADAETRVRAEEAKAPTLPTASVPAAAQAAALFRFAIAPALAKLRTMARASARVSELVA